MRQTVRGIRGIVVAPHALASQSALQVLREGGNAIEATIAAAATLAVVYPHMNSLGGDGFWLMHVPGEAPGVIDASGAAGEAACIDWYRERGMQALIPFRGGAAANTVAGTVSGWGAALKLSRVLGGRLPLKRLLEDAIHYAERGMPVSDSQSLATAGKCSELAAQPGFASTFLASGAAPRKGSLIVQKALGATLRRLARAGTGDFYRGELANSIAHDLRDAGSPLTLTDLRRQRAVLRDPLELPHSAGVLLNVPPPAQGVISLLILGVLDRLGLPRVPAGSADYVHLAVEAAKQALAMRDNSLSDPAWMKADAGELLRPEKLDELASSIHRHRASACRPGALPGGTVWLGVIDAKGRAVSFIQSLYHEFGCGIVLKETGICWQNRGCSFSLDPAHLNALVPGKKPMQTINPAMARLKDGRILVYGAMGGDGQPQTQSAVFTRIATYGWSPQDAVSAPRWLFGRTWGQQSSSLKLESRFPLSLAEKLGSMGHQVEIVGAWDECMGHAGALLRHANGLLEGGADPRSDGAVAAF